MSRPTSCVVGAIAVSCAIAGCAPHELTWELVLSAPEQRADVVRVRAAILRDGCRGDAVYTTEFAPDAAAPRPPELADGRYGFAGTAYDARCAAVATGCVEVELPTAIVTVPLVAVPMPAAECAAAQCVDGLCTGIVDDGCTGCTPDLCRMGRCLAGCGEGHCPAPTMCCGGAVPMCCALSCPADPEDDLRCIDPLPFF